MFRPVSLAAIAIALVTAPASAHQTPAAAAPAATPAVELVTPPATGTQTLIITSTGGTHGQVVRWTAPDGTQWARESLLLRGFKTEIDEQMKLNPDGSIRELVIRGTTPSGDAAESFRIENGRWLYSSPVDKAEAPAKAGAMYVPYGGLFAPGIQLAEALYKAPGRTLELAPSGRARLEPLTTFEVSNGSETKKLTAYTIDGLSFAPFPVWFDGDRLFAAAGFLNVMPKGWESVAPQLSKAQEEALAKRAPALLEQLAPRQSGAVVFNNVRIYDAKALTFRDNMTVVAAGGRITHVGPTALFDAAPGTKLIDGTGKTLVPGLWDAHQHYGGDLTGPLLLSTGITSVRDPGNKPDESIARKKRLDKGELLGPRVISVMLIDGPGPYSAQMAVVAKDEASAVAAVRKAKDMGFSGIKLYGSLDKKLVAPMAAEARRLGLRIQGHLPHGMRPVEAVEAGYSELTHINMAMMQAMPDSVVAETNTLTRFYGPGRYGADVDMNSPQMKAYIATLKKHGTVVDPTLAIFEGGWVPDTSETSPSYLPYAGILPPVTERGFRGGSFAERPDVSRAQMRKSFKKHQEFVVALYKAGVPIVAGTDGAGPELIRDLELYVEGGLTPAEALSTATIVPAKVFGVERDRGSIEVGKSSDLVLVNGDVSREIGALRRVDTVLLGDRLMRGDELRAAVGITGMPK